MKGERPYTAIVACVVFLSRGKDMKLSIIVPVYNQMDGGKLKFCLDSLVNQTISDYEIIAVDDKSTESSLLFFFEF